MDKKVVVLICEGQSDAIALEDGLQSLFSNSIFEFALSSGDFLSNEEDYSEDIDTLLSDKAIFRDDYNRDFKESDIFFIAHLIDTDGVFIPDDRVVFDGSLGFAHYYDESIAVCRNVPATLKLRANRRDRINECIGKTTAVVKGRSIPYQIFYMSCNLEHVTQGVRNVETQAEKIDLAKDFAGSFNGLLNFECFLRESNASGSLEHYPSWQYIKSHSLDRATNLIILVEKLRQYEKDIQAKTELSEDDSRR